MNKRSNDNAQRHDREAVKAAPLVPEARDSEAHGVLKLEMTRPDGVKVTKTLWGDKAYGGLQWPSEGSGRAHWRLESPRAISDEERAIQAMCLSDL